MVNVLIYVQIRLKLPLQCSLTDVITDALEVSIKSFTIINIICHPTIFLSSRVGGVDAFEEMDNCVLKAVEAVLPKVMLEFLNVILARRKGFAYIDGGGVVLDE